MPPGQEPANILTSDNPNGFGALVDAATPLARQLVDRVVDPTEGRIERLFALRVGTRIDDDV